MILILAGVFIATLALIAGAFVFINRRALAEADVARDRLRPATKSERAVPLLRDVRVSEVNVLNRLLAGKSWVDELQIQLMRADISMRPGAFVVLVVAAGLAGSFIAVAVASPVVATVFAIAGWTLPWLWLRRSQKKRLRLFESQIPDAIDMLVSAMKAGYSFQAATQFLGDEMPAPMGPEFARFYDEQRLGIDVRDGLISMQERLNSLDLKMFVTAVLIQRETGGNLADLLGNLANVVRERIAMRGNIETLVAEPKMSARVLAILPVVVFLALSVATPGTMQPMLESPGGRLALFVAAVGVVVGYGIMMRIADVDI